jgi:glucose/arabinose dehydrogenase
MIRCSFYQAVALTCVALPLFTLTSCGDDAGSSPPTVPALGLDTVLTGMNHPLFVTAPSGDRARLFIVERTGQVRILKNGVLLPTPFLDITAEVSNGSEQGLLGFAFAPDYATSGTFVVYYVAPGNTRTVLSRFHVGAGTPDVADPAEDTLLTISEPIGDHNGGMLAFGKDGYLYFSSGDGGCCGDPDGHGQDRTELLGSMLRLGVTATGPYAIPPGNPWATDPTFRHELWNYGLRNPWRFSFDRATGDLYIADVGDGTREEVDVVSHLSPGGENFGWRVMEGAECFGGGSCNTTGLTLPVLDYGHDQGCSIIGGYVYRGAAMPTLRGTYFYTDFCAAWIRSFRLSGGVVGDKQEYQLLDSSEFPSSFGEDADGELYVTTEAGNVYKLVAR